jgi:WD40 repeat protein
VLATTPVHVDFLNSVAFDPVHGDTIVTSSRDGVARVWKLGDSDELAELRGHDDGVIDAQFTADGRSVVTSSADGTARSWHVVDGPVIRHRDWVLDAAFSPQGDRVATAAVDGTARITPLAGGPPVRIGGVFGLQTANAIAFDSSGRRVALAGGHDAQYGEILVADATTGQNRQQLLPAGRDVRSVAFSPDGEWLLSTAVGAPPGLWRLSEFGTGSEHEPTEQLELPDRVEIVRAEYSPDGRSIATAGNDGVARVYDASTREETLKLRGGGVLAGATFSPDGARILTYGSDTAARVWDAATGRPVITLRGHASWITRGDYSPDGRRIVTGSVDQTTRVWDARTGRLLSIQRMHGDAVNSVQFHRDGWRILSASDDRTARVYACATCGGVEDLIRLAEERIVSPAG